MSRKIARAWLSKHSTEEIKKARADLKKFRNKYSNDYGNCTGCKQKIGSPIYKFCPNCGIAVTPLIPPTEDRDTVKRAEESETMDNLKNHKALCVSEDSILIDLDAIPRTFRTIIVEDDYEYENW